MAELKTLREALDGWMRGFVREVEVHTFSAMKKVSDNRTWVLSLLDASGFAGLRIVPPNALVALDLQAGARTLFRENEHARFEDISATEQAQYHEHLRRILEACGVHVPDEVHEPVTEENSSKLADGKGVAYMVYGQLGDTITITRNTSGSPNGCTGESILHPQGKEAE